MTTLTNAHILTMDSELTQYANGWIRLENGCILALGEGPPPANDDDTIDMEGDLIMPGMINPHSHIAMSLFRGLGEDVDDRLYRYILPLERELINAQTVGVGARLSCAELILGGVTTVADMYYFEEEIGQALSNAGLRGFVGQTLGNFDAPDHQTIDEAFDLTNALVDRFRDDPLITPCIAPHAPYSTGPKTLERVAQWVHDHKDARVQMHLAETDAENDWSQKNGGSSVEITKKAGLLGPWLIGAHCLHVSPRDIELLAEHRVGVAHNARANGKGGRGIAPICDMRAAGIHVGISTDGPMSSNTLDLFSQFAPVSMFQRLVKHTRKALSESEIIQMATIEGAKVLGISQKTGSLEIGKQADLIRISLSEPRLNPIYDIYSTLVFCIGPQDVRASMVAGRWLMKDRQLLTVDKAKTMADAGQVAQSFSKFISQIDNLKP